MTRLVDDIDGTQAVTTLSFALDGQTYEIDLSESHLSAFQQAIAPFVTAARSVPNGGHPQRAATPRPSPPKAPAPKTPAPKTPAAKASAPKAPKPTPESNGHVVPTEPAPEAAAATLGALPFRQPEPAAEPARPERGRAPLVANPFQPRT